MGPEYILAQQRAFFDAGYTRGLGFRREQLRKLLTALEEFEDDLLAALHADLRKSPSEGYLTELSVVRTEAKAALRHLGRWMRPRRHVMEPTHFPASVSVTPEPKGVVLVFSPWNYPLQLLLVPLVTAMASGNCAVLKPSQQAPATSHAIMRLVQRCFPPEYICVVPEGEDVHEQLLGLPFDHIFFTGSPRVGRIVMQAAAQHLTPVTLELGGKSPCIVDATAEIAMAARRIAWGKALNAGQTCVAPDYLLVHESVEKQLCQGITQAWRDMYGEAPLLSPDLPRVVTRSHFDRLRAMLGHGRTLAGGAFDETSQSIEPTLLTDIAADSPLATEEIFGPLLPMYTFKDITEVEAVLRTQPTPLALYLFSTDRAVQSRIMEGVPFGGGCINDVVIHLADPRVPFGGKGQSGMGHYHGWWGFAELSHWKSVVRKGPMDIPLRYPPFGNKLQLFRKLLK